MIDRQGSRGVAELTGRVASGPHELLRQEVLGPQLEFELANLLPWYVRLEKVLLLEYRRMDLLTPAQTVAIGKLLGRATPEKLRIDAGAAMSDLAFALEQFVTKRVDKLPVAWHVDRSRNDLQAAAQTLYGRDRILDVAGHLLAFGRAAHRLAARHTDVVMPGYTHLQAAQVISPGFYLAGVCEQVVHLLGRLDQVFATASASPMGAGAMAGQELPWDRDRMADLLGCESVRLHSLRAVAGRDWAIEAMAECALLGVSLSRFVTDLMTWGGAGYGFIDLPDEWSGISSAMPQKKNFPVLERIRGRTAHLSAGFADIAMGQHNTWFSNSVEVSKEAGSGVPRTLDTTVSVLRLFTAVLDNLRFRADRMAKACENDYLGGFTLANLLTVREDVPWRAAQVIAGRYIVAATERGLAPSQQDPALLEAEALERGHQLSAAAELLAEAFDVRRNLTSKVTAGATGPAATADLLGLLDAEFTLAEAKWAERRKRIDEACARIDDELDLDSALGAP